MRIHLKQHAIELSHLKCAFWEEMNTLICADIHIGKGGHFRKFGIGIPDMVNKNNHWNLAEVFDQFKPGKFLVLGDMVHSAQNFEWSEFADFLDNYPTMQRLLVRGNHELLQDKAYQDLGFEVFESLIWGNLHFTHEPLSDVNDDLINVCGHIHPAVRLHGQAGQGLRLPCYWRQQRHFVLPAFGTFTGMHVIKPNRGDSIYALAENKVIELS